MTYAPCSTGDCTNTLALGLPGVQARTSTTCTAIVKLY